jgi:hypothetical protein
MSEQATLIQMASLRDRLEALLEAMGGVVDLGVTACVMGEERMAGYWDLLRRYENNVQAQLQSVLDETRRAHQTSGAATDGSNPSHDLSAAVHAFITGFTTVKRCRTTDDAALADAIRVFRSGWERSHQAVDAIITGSRLGHPPAESAYHQDIVDGLSVSTFRQA